MTSGIPSFSIVGMPDAAIQESRERIRAACRAAGFRMPADKVVVNLAPGYVRKTGTGFDLPMALGILAATEQIDPGQLEGALVVGELSLDAGVREVTGLLAYQMTAKEEGLRLITGKIQGRYVPVEGVECHVLPSLGRARAAAFDKPPEYFPEPCALGPDLGDVRGNVLAKRALTVAAAGNHGLLMVGPPGSGKTMLARCLPSILPPLSADEALEAALVHSVVGEDCSGVLARIRPFRSPHHSASAAGLVGGGRPVRPGEISLAHRGVLFLDELSEFRPGVLQELRQPLEEGFITITRVDGTYELPASFMLVAATNPCPCGYFGDPEHECVCSEFQVRAYQNRIGGPLLDRIDIRIDVWRSAASALMAQSNGPTSDELRAQVVAARRFRARRQAFSLDSFDACLEACRMGVEARNFFESLVDRRALSARSALRTLRIARTVADLDARDAVGVKQLSEAVGLRFRAERGA